MDRRVDKKRRWVKQANRISYSCCLSLGALLGFRDIVGGSGFLGVRWKFISVGGGAIRLFYDACLEACEGDRGLDRF